LKLIVSKGERSMKRTSNYYIGRDVNGLEAIFYADGSNVPLSQEWPKVYMDGLVHGDSDYYIVRNKNGQYAIFHKDNPKTPLSQWHTYIYSYGLVDGESEYYIAENENRKRAIFHVHQPNEPISKWWDDVYEHGLVKNISDYYLVRSQDNYYFFHKDNKHVTVKSCDIYPAGITTGVSPYFVTTTRLHRQVFHIIDLETPLYEIPHLDIDTILFVNARISVFVKDYQGRKQIVLYNAFTQQSKILRYILKLYSPETNQSSSTKQIDFQDTEELIAKYIDHDLIPIITNQQGSLYNINGELIQEFQDISSLKQYLQEILKAD